MIIHKKGYIPIGISLPKQIVKSIDEKREDVSRSRYILRLIESRLNPSTNKDLLESRDDSPQSSKSNMP